jgi:hypothetical protein
MRASKVLKVNEASQPFTGRKKKKQQRRGRGSRNGSPSAVPPWKSVVAGEPVFAVLAETQGSCEPEKDP